VNYVLAAPQLIEYDWHSGLWEYRLSAVVEFCAGCFPFWSGDFIWPAEVA
jgi:hypothetical protein